MRERLTAYWYGFTGWLKRTFSREEQASGFDDFDSTVEEQYNTQVRGTQIRRVGTNDSAADDGTRRFAATPAVSPVASPSALPASKDAPDGGTRRFPRADMGETRISPRQPSARPRSNEAVLIYRPERLRPFPLALLFGTVKMFVAVIFVAGCLCLGIGLGIAQAYVETTPELDISKLTKSDLTSYIYDKDGELITTFAGMEYRDWANIDEIPDMLKNAVIAVEDVRFYKHDGVDFKRLFSAVINTLRNTDTHGGSTLTQQLIKNKILSSEQTYKRKIQEAYLAVELEQEATKDDILEAYLNDVHLGESNYGMKTAAKDYFGKQLNELSIRECAMLAGLIQKPYLYNPRRNMYQRDNFDITNERTDTVLDRMYSAGFISKEQYEFALKDTVKIKQVSEQKQLYEMPYFVEYAVRDVVTHMLEQRELVDTNANRTAIENELRKGGYKIYTTVDRNIQNTVQNTLSTWEEYPELADPTASVKTTTNADGTVMQITQPQAAAVVLDYHTGELRAVVGGRDTPTLRKQWNRAYQSATPVGSSIKPLAVYAPALDMGASPATIINNIEGAIEGYGGNGYPSIGDEKRRGPITIRQGVKSSLNIVAARTLFEWVTLERSRDYLIKLGVDESRINMDGPGLALGTSGITPIEMAAAYGALANGGVYKEPLAFTKVVDSEGKVVLDAADIREEHRVFQTSSAYLMIDMLKDAVKGGTGTKAKIEGMTVAGKTGTNSDYSSVYFSGVTPYYTATVWIGHDDYAKKLKKGATGGTYAAPLWQAFMEPVHEGLEDKDIIDVTPESLGLVQATVCPVSGLLATDACAHDSAGKTPVTDWFLEGSVPLEYCDMHAMVTTCKDSGMQASSFCPQSSLQQGSVVLISSTSPLNQFEKELVLKAIPNAVYTDIPASTYSSLSYQSGSLCTLHGGGFGSAAPDITASTVASAQTLVQQIRTFMMYNSLTQENIKILSDGVSRLEFAIAGGDVNQIASVMAEVQADYAEISYSGAVTPDAGTLPQATPETGGFGGSNGFGG